MRIISGLHEIADRYDAYLLDVFGVLHDGLKPFPDTINCLEQLKKNGKKTCLLSNQPRRAESAIRFNESVGILRSLYNEALTSGEGTWLALDAYKGKRCWYIGTDFTDTLLEGHDFTITKHPDDADFILNAVPGTESVEATALIEKLDRAAQKKLPMVCANPDLIVHIGDVKGKCAGSYAQYYETKGGPVAYYGKPHRPIYDMAWQMLGQPDKSRMIMIGDSLHTDIQGANGFGIHSILNLSGIHGEEMGIKPSIDKVKRVIDSQPHRPDYVLYGFEW